jgi:hypothetical protein
MGRFACGTRAGALVRAHVELFARRLVRRRPGRDRDRPASSRRARPRARGALRVPAAHAGAHRRGRLDPRLRPTLGDLFAVWGQRLSRGRLLSFGGKLRVYVAGKLRRGDPRTTPLTYHAQIVVQVGGYVPPHACYLFGPGR